ncbi:DUF5681 domain-containing protein [Novosphingobium sp.]|uniref:DUF5681 domain-containing protein n=1 Tax=Novosphingobium sp. TaxID=1874826 RepID=UPI00286EA36D|nr:DUF5681 domain-containing protein [Novosphingobium sp.]
MSDENLLVPYEVGYAKPPAQHRFEKGKSGNPAGRPKRSKAQPKQVNTGFGMKAAEEFLRMEAYRPIAIREGEQVIELPAIQAVFRAMGVSALKGNRFVQKTLTDMVARMEADHFKVKFELFGSMVEYKHQWDREIGRCRKAGLPEPGMIPHPDDIVLDPNSGDVKIMGPQTKEQKERLDHALARRAEAQEEVNYFADKYRRTRDPDRRQRHLDNWLFEQRMFDIINDTVGPRYKAKLENRSYSKGASREGRALEELRRDPKQRQEYLG